MFYRGGLYSQFKSYNIIVPADDNHGALILGDFTVALDVQLLEKLGVKAVLTTAAGLNISYPKKNFVHRTYNALDIDSYKISKHFDDAYEFIDENLKLGGVYVHCAAGVSRSASCVIYYLMRKNGWLFDNAFRFVQRKRRIINPNPGFVRQLRFVSNQLKLLRDQMMPKESTSNLNQGSMTVTNLVTNGFVNQQQQQQQQLAFSNVQQSTSTNNTPQITKSIQKIKEKRSESSTNKFKLAGGNILLNGYNKYPNTLTAGTFPKKDTLLKQKQIKGY